MSLLVGGSSKDALAKAASTASSGEIERPDFIFFPPIRREMPLPLARRRGHDSAGRGAMVSYETKNVRKIGEVRVTAVREPPSPRPKRRPGRAAVSSPEAARRALAAAWESRREQQSTSRRRKEQQRNDAPDRQISTGRRSVERRRPAVRKSPLER